MGSAVLKLGRHICVFGTEIYGINKCNVWKAEKRNTCTNTGALWMTEIITAAVCLYHFWFGPGEILGAWFLLERAYNNGSLISVIFNL